MGARWVNAALVALACAAGLLWTAVAAFHVSAVQDFDTRLFYAFYSIRQSRTSHLAIDIVNFGDPKPFAALALLLVATALALRRYRVAVAVAVAMAGANLTTQLLQPLTAAPRSPLHLPFASWPSGHTTAIAVFALCAILVAPARLRGLVTAAAAVLIVAMSYSVLILGTHHPSDVLAGILVAGLWAAAAVAVLERAGWEPAGVRAGTVLLLAPIALAVVSGIVLAVLVRSSSILAFVSDRAVLAAGAALLAAIAFAVASATALVADA